MCEFRTFLHRYLAAQLADALTGKVDISGVVQQTLLEAHAVGEEWDRWEEERRLAWLRRAALNNLRDEIRRYAGLAGAAEFSIDQPAPDRDGTIADALAADHSTPSQRAARNEARERLAAALARLHDDQRRAVELHHLQGLPLAETAERMGRSVQSVVGLLFRALKQLKGELTNE